MTLSLWALAFLWDEAPTGGVVSVEGATPGRPLRRGCFDLVPVPITLGHLGIDSGLGTDLAGAEALSDAERVVGEASDWIDHPQGGICRLTFRDPGEHPPALLGLRRLARPVDSHLSIGYVDATPEAPAVEAGEVYEVGIVDRGGFMATGLLGADPDLDALRAGRPLHLGRFHGRRLA